LNLVGTGPKTFVARIMTSSTNRLGILSYSPTGGATAGTDLRLVLNAGNALRMEINSGAAQYDNINLADGEWHVVAAIVPDAASAKDITFFIDGTIYGDELGSGTTINTGDTVDNGGSLNIRIGGDQTTNTIGAFNGQIDWVGVYDSALTASEIAAIPEPATMSLLVMGGLVAVRRRRRA
jgi:hypothetical protein